MLSTECAIVNKRVRALFAHIATDWEALIIIVIITIANIITD